MANIATPKVRRPSAIELRNRVVAALDGLFARYNRQDWRAVLSSEELHLVIDDEYRAWVTTPPAAVAPLFSLPLASLGLDPWAVELGGGVKDAAFDVLAQAVARAVDRPGWWVP